MQPTIDPLDASAVTIGRDGTYLLIYPPDELDTGTKYAHLPISVRSANVSASSGIDLAGWGEWVPGFIGFFDGLAAAWKGWEGTREWRDDDGGVEFRAVHRPVGGVELTVRLDPSLGLMPPGGWVLEVVVQVKPSQLKTIARSVHRLLKRVS
jgi:hypothetical protein